MNIKPLSQQSPESVEHNKGRLAARLAEYATKPVGRIGNPPRWMTKEEKKIWRTLAVWMNAAALNATSH